MEGQTRFTVGPPDPVTDSRLFPVVSPEEEEAFVSGADLGDEHPDNTPLAEDGADYAPPAPDESGDDAVLPAAEDLDTLVADVDVDAVDDRGFDDGDLATDDGTEVP